MKLETDSFPKASELYKITFEHRPHYLHVCVSGERDSYEISKKYWQEIAEECKKSGVKKVLIEEDIVEDLPMHDTYRLASELPKFGFLGVRIAFIDLRAEHNQLNQFGETVATNRGLQCRIFRNAADGERWLLS